MTNRKGITEAQAQEVLEKKAKRVTAKDVEDVVKRKQEIDTKLKKVPGTLGKMVNQVKLLYEMIRDYVKGDYREIPWWTIAMSVAAIIYFLSPIDLIPDPIPVVGYVDDALVIALAIRAIQEDLRKYCSHKGYKHDQYF